MPNTTRFRVAICGGGIAGLTLALALSRYPDIEIDVYESAARFEDIGAGLAIWGRGLVALRKLGLEQRIREIATIPPGKNQDARFELRKADQASEGELFGILTLSTTLGLHRSQFVSLLVQMLIETGRVNTHFGKRCVSFNQGKNGEPDNSSDRELVTVLFGDGTSVTCDALIGCDGIKSAVRKELNGQIAEVSSGNATRSSGTQFSGAVAYRALVKPEDLRALAGEHSAITMGKMYCGKEKHVVTYPVGRGRFLNVIAYSSDSARSAGWGSGPWVAEADHEELLDQYKHFEPEVQALLKCIDKSSRWALHDVEPLEFWSSGRVTLLGDAAHATTPFIGSGGGQVFEDVYTLSHLLGSPEATRSTLPSVLLAYEHVRRPRANRVIHSSREARRAFEFLGEYAQSTNEEVRQGLVALTEWLIEGKGDPDEDVQEAEMFLREFAGTVPREYKN